jgi:hypothetical protein
MHERWLEALRPLASGERALAAVREIARHHRIQASPGYDDAANGLVRVLESDGLDPVVEHAPGDGMTALAGCRMPEGWTCERAHAVLHSLGGATRIAEFPREPLSLIQRSAPASGRFPVVSIPDGTRAEDYAGSDVRGRVVLTEGAVQRVHRHAVIERGAAGLLAYGRRLLPPARTRDHDRDSLAYTSYWWGADEPRGWGFVVSPGQGDALAARLGAGESLELEVEIVSARGPRAIPIVSASLPGDWPGEVLLTGHLCHPKPGANDNASGAAAVLEAMRALAALAADGGLPSRRRTIRALWMPEFTGTYAWLGAEPARARRTLAAFNLDMVGEDQRECASVQLLERAPHFAGSFADELARIVRHASSPGVEPGGQGVRVAEVPYAGGSDHALWVDPAVGVPCPMLIQWPDRYYHSSLDTPDRCDPRSLAHAALAAATYAAALATAGPVEVEWLAGRIESAARREMRSALQSPAPARGVRAARLRAQRALASLGRFASEPPGPGPGASRLGEIVGAAAEAIEGAFDGEISPELAGAPPEPARAASPRVPVRRQRTLLAPMRSLQPGWTELDGAARDRLHALEQAMPGGSTTLDLAWFAADGERSVDEIAERLADEGTTVEAAALEGWFDAIAATGACAWRRDAKV